MRVAVLKTWVYLAEHRAIPLGHWLLVTGVARGRLEDKSSLVRKEALRLVQALMLHNPFGPALPVERFAASLESHRGMLERVLPPSPQQGQGVVGDEIGAGIEVVREGERGGGGEAAAEGAAGEARVKAEAGAEGEGMEVDGEEAGGAAPEAAAAEQPRRPAISREWGLCLVLPAAPSPAGPAACCWAEGLACASCLLLCLLHASRPSSAACLPATIDVFRPPFRPPTYHPAPSLPHCPSLHAAAEAGWDGTVEELQALVASLGLAVGFSKALTAAMPVLANLLASSSVTDVQESIALLLAAKQFEVDGAAATIRRMLPLIFSQDQGEGGGGGWGMGGPTDLVLLTRLYQTGVQVAGLACMRALAFCTPSTPPWLFTARRGGVTGPWQLSSPAIPNPVHL